MMSLNGVNGAILQSNGGNPVHEAHVEHDADVYPVAEKLHISFSCYHQVKTALVTPKVSPATRELVLNMGRYHAEQLPYLSGYFKLHLNQLTIRFEACILWGLLGRGGLHDSLYDTAAGCIAAFLREVQGCMETTRVQNVEINLTVKLMGNERIPTPDRAPILSHPDLNGFTFEDDNGDTFVALPEVPHLRCVIFI